jgi:regulator of cell morphogenesis and NO signaling
VTPLSPATTVAELVVERPARARLFEQLGLDYCCGGRASLEEACRSRGLDAATVVAMLAAAEAADGADGADWSQAGLGELCDHIVGVHHAYLRRELPRLSTLLDKVERAHGGEVAEAADVRAVFAVLRTELERHLDTEERSLFPACRRLESGTAVDASFEAALEAFEDEHAAAGTLLRRLEELTDGYDTAAARCNTHRAALDGLRELERDLHEHIHEENNILFPRALAAAGR